MYKVVTSSNMMVVKSPDQAKIVYSVLPDYDGLMLILLEYLIEFVRKEC